MSLNIKEIPVDKKNCHPNPPSDILPRHEFSMGIIAPKGSGKTTLICNLLDFYKTYFHGIIVFSPTVKNDDKWVYTKKQKLLAKNTKLESFLRKHKLKDKMEKFCIHLQDDYNSTIPEDCFFYNYSSNDLSEILEDQQELVTFLEEKGGSKHLANRLLFIFDDLVGSNLFGNERKNPFKMFNSNMRHYSASIIMVSQAFKEIPKTVRTQFSSLILFEIYSDNEIKAVMEEFPMSMGKDQWLRVYKYCTKDPYSFLFYNMQRPKEKRIMKNFNENIQILSE